MSDGGILGAHLGVNSGVCHPLDDDAFPSVDISRGVAHGMDSELVAKRSSEWHV